MKDAITKAYRWIGRLNTVLKTRSLFSIGAPILLAGILFILVKVELPVTYYSESALPGISDIVLKKDRHQGVSLVGARGIDEVVFESLLTSNVNWIVQIPFGWQQNYDSPEILLARDGRILWGEKDKGIAETTRLARSFGLKTMLKPHIWLRNRSDGKWRSDIAMANETDWQNWFVSYEALYRYGAA
jgi:hypothetical protein